MIANSKVKEEAEEADEETDDASDDETDEDEYEDSDWLCNAIPSDSTYRYTQVSFQYINHFIHSDGFSSRYWPKVLTYVDRGS